MIRRNFLKTAAALAANFPRPSAAGAASYRAEMPDMLLQYLARRLNALSAKWDQERAQVRTPAQIDERNRYVRGKFIEMLGGLPERTPLNPVVVRTLERDRYRVENVMYESRPGFPVTANLYVPTTGRGPFPAILSPCGHEWDGRMYRLFQLTYLDLVRNGFVVLGFDPVGMGERREYAEGPDGRSELGGPLTWEHSLPGQLLLLLGENLTQYRVWDAMRSLDYLAGRPEVDKNRIGCAGQSSGGLFTMFLSAIDDRIRCAAVHEGGTQRKWPVEIRPETVVDPPDIEQNLFPAALWGVDLPDLHAAIAPRPLLATHERFSTDFLKAAAEVRARYELLGVPEKFAIASADDPHAMTMKLRLATVDWFSRWFLDRKGPEREPDWTLEPRERLYCTSTGLVRTSHLGDTLLLRMAKKQARLPPPGAAASVDRIRQMLHFRKSDGPLGVREIITTPRRGYRVEKIEFLSEPGIYIPAWVFVPEAVKDRAPILYVGDRGVDSDGVEFGPIEALVKHGRIVAAVDVRGIGETRPPHLDISGRNEFRHVDSVETAMTYIAWEMNESLLGMRVQDVVRSVDYVLSRPDVDRASVRAVGSERGALWVLFAAALDDRIQAAVCAQGLLSYRTLTGTDRYTHGADIFIPSILEHFDLPQVAAALVPRRLSVVAPVDAMKRPVDAATAERTYDWTRQVYTKAGAGEQFRIVAGPLAASDYFALL